MPSPAAMPGPRLVLIGPPGAGKSTVAAALAARWRLAARDTDADVEAVAGKSVADVFVEDGEPHFRELERTAVLSALADHDGILALGGGAVLHPDVRAALAAYRGTGGVVVFLDVSLAHAAPRVGINQARPLLVGSPRAQWQTLMDARRPVYEEVATVRVSTDGLRPVEVAEVIESTLEARGATEAGA